MPRSLLRCALACAIAVSGCGGDKGPMGPTPQPPRISRTRFLAFGDSFTAGEVTSPISSSPSGIHRLILVPTASYPSQLQAQLRAVYVSQSASIIVMNSGEPSERILDGAQRFPGVFDANRPEVVLLQEGANGLPQVGPDISTGVMRTMVQAAKNGGARVFVGSMIPQVAGRPRATTPVSETLAYNNVLQLMSAQEGVTYVDLYTAILPDAAALIGSDGLHPTEAGYRKIADLFFAAIRTVLEDR
jgi:lysophospholipase L1-like esterase